MKPLNSFRELLNQLTEAETKFINKATARVQDLEANSSGKWGKLGEIAIFLSGWKAKERPLITKPLLAIFAGKHAVIENNLAGKNNNFTESLVKLYIKGSTATNQICVSHNLSLKIFDLALKYPADDFLMQESMTEKNCAATMAFGMEVTADNVDLLCLSSLGWENNFIASTIAFALYGGKAEDWLVMTQQDTKEILSYKAELIEQAVNLHKQYLTDSFEILKYFGGREFAAMTGAILAARMNKIPVILDNFTAVVAAAILHSYDSKALDHCLIASLPNEKIANKLAEKLNKKPLLNLNITSEEGMSAALAANIVKDAALIFHNSEYDQLDNS
ncbi:nicotinate-nucleotide--dimethylbenzimidazole phosphoribosyltransferase [Bartonella sp. DGB1]|uniref:nicotinate-nucleotide--dimethylbenzimidazole phosphoribosyltransferase n=1 Tax=Bartonella sp. DGB1 TaxID=3239807 RepID=UPI0035241CEB